MALPLIYHLTARVGPMDDPFPTRASCAALWHSLGRAFPQALVALLMPSHVHVITPVESREIGIQTLGAVLSGFSRGFHPGQNHWSTSTKYEPIQSESELRRQIRYVLLNPCRDRLCADPLMWEWSTYRDVIGVAAPPWSDIARLRRYFGYPSSRFRKDLHAYISGDPSVAVAGTAPPRTSSALIAPVHSLLWAVLSATRDANIDPGLRGFAARRLTAHLARRLGLVRVKDLVPILGVGERAVYKSLARPPSPAEELVLVAAVGLLSEPRFQVRNRLVGQGAGLVSWPGG